MAIGPAKMEGQVAIRKACTEEDVASFRQLVTEFYAFLNEDLSFQDIDSETAGLPGHYAAPGGVILLAADGGADAGCVALRPALGERVKNGVCVMKRLYVRPGHQGRSIGRLLVQAAIGAARELGYSGIVLDTLGRLESANKLYDGMGFQICQEPFYDSPLPGTVCWHMQL